MNNDNNSIGSSSNPIVLDDEDNNRVSHSVLESLWSNRERKIVPRKRRRKETEDLDLDTTIDLSKESINTSNLISNDKNDLNDVNINRRNNFKLLGTPKEVIESYTPRRRPSSRVSSTSFMKNVKHDEIDDSLNSSMPKTSPLPASEWLNNFINKFKGSNSNDDSNSTSSKVVDEFKNELEIIEKNKINENDINENVLGINMNDTDDQLNNKHDPDEEEIQTMTDELFQKFESKHNSMPELEPTGEIISNLYSHQKKALYWMFMHEQNDEIEVESLESKKDGYSQFWTKSLNGRNIPVYKHVETGERRLKHPVLTRGGMLCDDMGLGKTLVTLSLIVTAKSTNHEMKSTLVVCPASVMNNWADEIQKHISWQSSIKFLVYHGSKKNILPENLNRQDIVITSYDTLRMDGWDSEKEKLGPLHSLHWFRVILDEGHIIKNKKTSRFKSCVCLKAERRWILTGTPIQNGLKDLYSLFAFIRLEPFDDFNTWNSLILKNPNFRAGQVLLQKILDCAVLRRTKEQKLNNVPIVDLPPKTIVIRKIEQFPQERTVYEKLSNKAKVLLLKTLKNGELAEKIAFILEMLLRLRQTCCHPSLVPKILDAVSIELHEDQANGISDLPEDKIREFLQVLIDFSEEECPICYEKPIDCITRCSHKFCTKCINKHIQTSKEKSCPFCRRPLFQQQLISKENYSEIYTDMITVDLIPSNSQDKVNKSSQSQPNEKIKSNDIKIKDSNILINSDDTIVINGNKYPIDVDWGEIQDELTTAAPPYWKYSCKINYLIQSLLNQNQSDSSVKSVVFSQFTKYLDIIEVALCDNGFNFVRIDGSIDVNARSKSIEIFNKRSDCKVILVSLLAAGVGINLTAASRVFMMDMWWNPAIQNQAIDRVFRIGQKRPVKIEILQIENTIEDKILLLQKRKMELMKSTLHAKREDFMAAREQDLRLLFDL